LLCIGWLARAALAAGPPTLPAAEPPRIFPDYVGVTLPPNVAPLNFSIQESASAYRVELRSANGPPIALSSRTPAIRIPRKAWAALLQANPGQPFYWDIAAQTAPSGWTRYLTVTNRIAREEIDGWLAYRRHRPIFNFYKQLGIYQRNLESFDQTRILGKQKFDEGCLNCHTPCNRSPETFAFNIRAHGGKHPMILVVSNQPTRVERTMGYLAWHPSGRRLAFSANKLSLFFHTRGETQDVYDANSDLGIYAVDSNAVVFPPPIAAPDRNETWPTWSPDGRHLYFSSAAPQPIQKYRQIRYDLMRVAFDIDTGQWGQPERVISGADLGLSVTQPKISPDGHLLLVTLSSYGHFPIHQPGSDLYAMDLASRELRRLEINSDQADTWHSWSGNSRWVVFSSKRIDGLLARPHFSYVDDRGRFHKPFLLPQEDPAFYGFCLDTFNVPEFMQGAVTVRENQLARTIVKPSRVLNPQGPARPGSTNAGPAGDPSGYQNIRE
jgi:hypothetical protein